MLCDKEEVAARSLAARVVRSLDDRFDGVIGSRSEALGGLNGTFLRGRFSIQSPVKTAFSSPPLATTLDGVEELEAEVAEELLSFFSSWNRSHRCACSLALAWNHFVLAQPNYQVAISVSREQDEMVITRAFTVTVFAHPDVMH